MKSALVIMNDNLRLYDHPALSNAVLQHKKVYLVYIDKPKNLGVAKRWWLTKSIEAFRKECPLLYRRGKFCEVITQLVAQYKVEKIYASYSADRKRQQEYQKWGVTICRGNFLLQPEDVMTKEGSFYKVYTPFWKSAQAEISVEKLLPKPPLASIAKGKSDELPKLEGNYGKYWQPGEKVGRAMLSTFVKKGLSSYDEMRNRVDVESTSKLSPYIHFGALSIREVWKKGYSSYSFCSELGFREYSYYLLHHFPNLPKENYHAQFDRFTWEKSKKQLTAWKEGSCGYPIVDGAMRELYETGWMHNRLRMIVASFLTKDLLVDWRKGETWFLERLIDGDEAINAFNWQWVAGTGIDASPYFRIFNPTTQAEKFDPEGKYRKKWAPKNIAPIVDHNKARLKALALYKSL